MISLVDYPMSFMNEDLEKESGPLEKAGELARLDTRKNRLVFRGLIS